MLDFACYTKPDYEVNWHHKIVAEALDRFAARETRRLMVFMPPRTGKSELVSRRLPAFIFGHNPNARIIACSHTADLAGILNRDVQIVIDSPEYHELFPDTRLYGANVRTVGYGSYLRNSDVFEIVGHHGKYISKGVGGAIMGDGFDYGIIDDPIKSREEANSPTYRKRLFEWFTGTFYNRQEKDACILVTVTRWHEGDLPGALLELANSDSDADQWEVISLPMIAEKPTRPTDIPTHPLDLRAQGEPLWPTKFPPKRLKTMQATMGSYNWASLYQQRPAPAEGALFKRDWFGDAIEDKAPEGLQWARYWDLAASTKSSADFTASAAVAFDEAGNLWIRDMIRGRWEWPDAKKEVMAQMLGEPKTLHAIEKALQGIAAVQELQREPTLRNISLQGVDVDKDKLTRALPWVARAEARKVRLVRGAWVNAFIDEVCSFPQGANDDQVDTISGGVAMLSEPAPPSKKMVSF